MQDPEFYGRGGVSQTQVAMEQQALFKLARGGDPEGLDAGPLSGAGDGNAQVIMYDAGPPWRNGAGSAAATANVKAIDGLARCAIYGLEAHLKDLKPTNGFALPQPVVVAD